MVLKKMLRINKEIKAKFEKNKQKNDFLVNLVFNYSEYMANNHYVVSKKSKLIIHDNSKESKIFLKNNALQLQKNKNLKLKNRIKKSILTFIKEILTRFLNKKVKVESNKKFFSGQLLMVLHGQSRVKIFDFINHEAINFENDIDLLNNALKTKDLYEKHFNITIKEINFDKKIIYENIINFIPNNFNNLSQKRLLYNDFLVNYLNLLKNTTINEEIMLNDHLENFNNKLQSECYYFIEEFNYMNQKTKLPKIPQHGDIVLKNVLYDGNNWYLIDFELAAESSFLVDLFSILIKEVFVEKDNLFKDYLDGKFDDKIEMIFNEVGLEYHNNRAARVEYLFIAYLYKLTLSSIEKNIPFHKIIEQIQIYGERIKQLKYADNV